MSLHLILPTKFSSKAILSSSTSRLVAKQASSTFKSGIYDSPNFQSLLSYFSHAHTESNLKSCVCVCLARLTTIISLEHRQLSTPLADRLLASPPMHSRSRETSRQAKITGNNWCATRWRSAKAANSNKQTKRRSATLTRDSHKARWVSRLADTL